MRNWRIISTVAAVVLAAIAGVVVWKYVTNADTRAEKNKNLVTALVAKHEIPRGTVFDQVVRDNLFREVKIPADALPPNRILPGSDQALLAIYKDKVAVTDIFAGTPVVADQFVQASQLVNTVAGAIPKGKEAITVSLDQTHAVGGFLTPGDTVNVLLSFTPKLVTDPATGKARRVTEPLRTTAFLLPGMKVLAVGSTTIIPSSGAPASGLNGETTTTTQPQIQPASLITLEVTPRQAEQIVQATAVGTLYLSLNPPGFDPTGFTTPREIIEALNHFDEPFAPVTKTLNDLGQP
ncbi:MAG TPA: Flp pilus assembly protein CpaB [Acidimicrobiia bacterium]|nr:Flp pilus assembly protein CpaB [Acidimicrobiia bacterium]